MMTPRLGCEEARDLAAEMALGTLAGDERAKLITHIASCSECRTTVEELSRVADSLLLLGPEREPPGGFESAFLAQFNAPVRRRRLRWLATTAAACVAAFAAAGGVLWATAADRDLASHYRAALAEADGEYFGVRPIHLSGSGKVGNLFAYEGHPSWIFVIFEDDVASGEYRAEILDESGGYVFLGELTIEPDKRTWGSDVAGSLEQVESVRFVDAEGETLNAEI